MAIVATYSPNRDLVANETYSATWAAEHATGECPHWVDSGRWVVAKLECRQW
jgi:hypothetical protein